MYVWFLCCFTFAFEFCSVCSFNLPPSPQRCGVSAASCCHQQVSHEGLCVPSDVSFLLIGQKAQMSYLWPMILWFQENIKPSAALSPMEPCIRVSSLTSRRHAETALKLLSLPCGDQPASRSPPLNSKVFLRATFGLTGRCFGERRLRKCEPSCS